MTNYETVCITRCGFNFLHSEGVDLAARVVRHRYEKREDGSTFQSLQDQRDAQVLFIPRFGVWG
jgi:hypothetical protein